jgi:O-succinylbenzoic acid--CoA ligase
VTLTSLVPTQLERLLQNDRFPPESLRAVLLGGAPPSRALLERALRLGWPIRKTYGMTETCSMVTLEAAGAGATSESAGLLLPGTEMRIEAGIIEVRGPTLMSGYLPATPAPKDGWFRTRDLGRFDAQGCLEVLGRADESIVSGGENVQPREVEAVLLGAEEVAEACVFGVPDAQWGQRVAAALVVAGTPDWDKLERLLCGALARFKHPRLVVVVDALPLTPSGKIDRKRVARDCAVRASPWPAAG